MKWVYNFTIKYLKQKALGKKSAVRHRTWSFKGTLKLSLAGLYLKFYKFIP